ncbi:MAG: hypothetical protein KDN22_25505 [Verrucomicrobiae bacterium]|nr:hypothetical protein [Verrucomicrobiae bacterium]
MSGKLSRDIIQERKGKICTVCYEIVDKRSAPEFLTLKFRDRFDDMFPYRLMKRATQIDESHLRIVFSEELVIVKGVQLEPILLGLSNARITFLREAPDWHLPRQSEGYIENIALQTHDDDG